MGFFSRLYARDQDEPASDGDEVLADGSLEDTRFRLAVEAILNEVRPTLHADGGDIELIGIVGRSVRVRMMGACDGCASASFTLRLGIEKRLRDVIPDFEELIPV